MTKHRDQAGKHSSARIVTLHLLSHTSLRCSERISPFPRNDPFLHRRHVAWLGAARSRSGATLADSVIHRLSCPTTGRRQHHPGLQTSPAETVLVIKTVARQRLGRLARQPVRPAIYRIQDRRGKIFRRQEETESKGELGGATAPKGAQHTKYTQRMYAQLNHLPSLSCGILLTWATQPSPYPHSSLSTGRSR